MTYKEQLQGIANQYIAAGEPWPATSKQIAGWAIRRKLWAPQPASLVARCAEELADAMSQEYMTDPQGRTVRVKHAAILKDESGPRQMVWVDIRTATREQIAVSIQLRRQHVIGECRHMKATVDSFNENYNPDEPLQLVLDYTQDVAELEAIERAHRPSSSNGRPLPWRRFRIVPPPTA
jgi:hypothetical protein